MINCNLVTRFFSVTVTDYSYTFVIKLRNSVTYNKLLPNTVDTYNVNK